MIFQILNFWQKLARRNFQNHFFSKNLMIFTEWQNVAHQGIFKKHTATICCRVHEIDFQEGWAKFIYTCRELHQLE
jgi:hypothetical protein